MPFGGSWDDCERKIEEAEAVYCSVCGCKKHYHKECFEKHNGQIHSGKASSKPSNEMFDIGTVIPFKHW